MFYILLCFYLWVYGMLNKILISNITVFCIYWIVTKLGKVYNIFMFCSL